MTHQSSTSLQHKINERRALRGLCAQAVAQQIEAGNAEASHLRNRKRYLAKQVLKKIPTASRRSPRKLLHAATMVLAMWGFVGISMPNQAEAAPLFKHVMFEGFGGADSAPHPALADIDGDGDLDVFVGGHDGTIRFYRNTGTNTTPTFVSVTGASNPLNGVAVALLAAPGFVDIDNDGDLDVFVGDSNGLVKFYRNTGTNTAPTFVAANGTTIVNPLNIDVGLEATPAFVDIDGDGDFDAFVGDTVSTVKFWRNTGTAVTPVFTATGVNDPNTAVAVINPLAGLNFVSLLRTFPTFIDIDGDGDFDAFVGGKVAGGQYTAAFYKNYSAEDGNTNTVPRFVLVPGAGNPLNGLLPGSQNKPTFADIDGDGDFDAFVGSRTSVDFFQNGDTSGVGTAPVFSAYPNTPLAGFKVGLIYAFPTFADIDNDGDLDAFVGERLGTVKFYRNNGNNAAPNFVADAANNPLAPGGTPFDVGTYAKPAFADIDGDGDLDAFIGEYGGTVKFYRNNGTNAAPNFAADLAGNPLALVSTGASTYSAPTFGDIDGDGDLDAFVGERLGTVKFYRNDDASGAGTAPVFVAVAGTLNPLNGFNVGGTANPTFEDIDGDGDLDAFVGGSLGTVKFYRNDDASGAGTAPVFVAVAGAPNPLNGFDVGVSSAPALADIDGDGDLDAFIGEYNGTVKFFENFDSQKITLPGGAGNLIISVRTAGASIPSASMAAAALVNPPAGNFPFGKISYNVTTTAGGTVVVRMVFPSGLPTGFFVEKVDAANNYTLMPTTQYTQVNSTTLDITLTDGGTFDLDGVANGVIVDPITIGVSTAGGGGGGCVIQSSSKFDPIFPAILALLAGLGLIRRRQK